MDFHDIRPRAIALKGGRKVDRSKCSENALDQLLSISCSVCAEGSVSHVG